MDDIGSRKPINKTAALVTGKGVHFDSKKKIVQRHWSVCPKLKPVSKGCPDLRGKRVGHFTVVGKYSSRKNRGSMWAVRCDCGDFETRSSKAIKNVENYGDRCELCRELSHLKRKEVYNRHPKARQPDFRDL